MISSCALFAQQQGEALIGTAPWTQRFILLECPHPWGKAVAQTPGLPHGLAGQLADWTKRWPGTRFLLFTGDRRPQPNQPRRIFIFEAPGGATQQYQAMQLLLSDTAQFGPALVEWFAQRALGRWPRAALPLKGRHVFICTHGGRDRCCGRYGYPFYRQASALVSTLETEGLLPTNWVQTWQVSHISGHRFAPTLVDLPEGRYYGALTLEDWRSLLLHQGALELLSRVYRGWAYLPELAQAVERLLWQQQGWQWLGKSLSYQQLSTEVQQRTLPATGQSSVQANVQTWQISLTWGSSHTWQASIQSDPSRQRSILGSCGHESLTQIEQYQVMRLKQLKCDLIPGGMKTRAEPSLVQLKS